MNQREGHLSEEKKKTFSVSSDLYGKYRNNMILYLIYLFINCSSDKVSESQITLQHSITLLCGVDERVSHVDYISHSNVISQFSCLFYKYNIFLSFHESSSL